MPKNQGLIDALTKVLRGMQEDIQQLIQDRGEKLTTKRFQAILDEFKQEYHSDPFNLNPTDKTQSHLLFDHMPQSLKPEPLAALKGAKSNVHAERQSDGYKSLGRNDFNQDTNPRNDPLQLALCLYDFTKILWKIACENDHMLKKDGMASQISGSIGACLRADYRRSAEGGAFTWDQFQAYMLPNDLALQPLCNMHRRLLDFINEHKKEIVAEAPFGTGTKLQSRLDSMQTQYGKVIQEFEAKAKQMSDVKPGDPSSNFTP